MRSTWPRSATASGVRIVEEEVAGPLLVIGDGFDIDQRAREFENVHKRPLGEEKPGEGEDTPRAGVPSIPIALHPPELRVTVGRY
jgi:hypothetical protein